MGCVEALLCHSTLAAFLFCSFLTVIETFVLHTDPKNKMEIPIICYFMIHFIVARHCLHDY